MTRNSNFKQRIRQRMKKTGERYTAARFHLLNQTTPSGAGALAGSARSQPPGMLPGYPRFGGNQPDVAVLRNVFQFAGITNPLTGQPFTENMLNGLCGGLGFLYAVFEYKGWPPMLTITARSRSMPDAFIRPVFERCGVSVTIHETTSGQKAERVLGEVLDRQRAAICLVDFAALGYYGMPEQMTGMSPHHVAVAGQTEDAYLLDDRAISPARIGKEEFARARAGYRKGKHRLIETDGVADDRQPPPEYQILQAIGDTVRAMDAGETGVPKSFRVNCGFAGLEKLSRLLTDTRDKKSWARVFGERDRACAGLRRLYECLQYEYTTAAAGRLAYADFLDEVEQVSAIRCGNAAGLFRKSAEHWQQLLAVIEACQDAAVRRCLEIIDRRAELLDQVGSDAEDEMRELWQERAQVASQCRLTATRMAGICREMARQVDGVIDIERQAVAALSETVAAENGVSK